MSKFELSEFKNLLNAASEQRREHEALLRRVTVSHETQRVKNRRAVAEVLGPFLSKAGLDLDKMNKVLANNQDQLRRNFQTQKIESAKQLASQKKAVHRAIELGHEALQHLGNRPAAFDSGLSSLISLTTPFFISEWPQATPELKRSHIQPLNSWAKILIDIPAYSFDNNEGSDSREFSFYFRWDNDSDYLAVAKVFSVLSLTGSCEAWANSGVLSGDKMNLSVQASLYPITYWLPVPSGGSIYDLRVQGDPLQSQYALDLHAFGGDWFDDPSESGVPKIFSATPFGMSFGSGSFGGIAIPGRATALFEVSLKVSWEWHGNTLPDELIADFADDNLEYNVGCPIVVLQLLTAPPA